MPEYLAPGVFVEEVSYRAKSIEGVGTSVAAIVGPTRTGPVRGTPEVCTSYADFERMFGDDSDLDFADVTGTTLNHTALAARAFFDNGGKQLYVSRITGSGATAASVTGNGNITFTSRFPGNQGEYTLEIRWRDSENLLRSRNLATLPDGERALLVAGNIPASAKGGSALADDQFPINVTALVERDGDNYTIINTAQIVAKVGSGDEGPLDATTAAQLTELVIAEIPDDARLTQVRSKRPASGGIAPAGEAAVITLSAETDLSAFTGQPHWGDTTTLFGTLNQAGTEIVLSAALNDSIGTDTILNLSALAAATGVTSMMVQRNLDIDVRNGGADGEVIYTYSAISLADGADNSLTAKMPATPGKRYDALTSPIQATVTTPANAYADLVSMFDAAHLTGTALTGPRYIISLTNGSDGDAPASADYAGEEDEINGSTGFAALENVEDISIVMAPAASAATATTHQGVVLEMQKHCAKMRYRVGIVDAAEGVSLSEVREFAGNFDDSRLALYYPWITTSDPTRQRDTINLPPAGFIAGIYANTDVQRGVHKAPANEVIRGALRFAQDINRFQQELLNPNGINCLRALPGRGNRVWGGRTLSSDPEWKYVNVRRYFLFLERSIEKSTQWAVFEPNGEALWANVRTAIEDFLYNEWRNGHLLGASPKEAYFVRCDRSTMTQNDLDSGRLVCQIGVAPLRPAEFVIFRIGQKTADANG
ncbi:MAG TPA: phage tail protein [Candidatus Tenderia sp.]|nr:phage tail protein [Candidatus Tenderia sp.]